ncbi:hypothetical protein [Ramlibacter sp.]|uniref:hypothetical protein n=1 Tax=Ramlibacter sp. TaxID=1917967 RepID=UPI002FC636DF
MKGSALLFLAVTAVCGVVLRRLAPEWDLLQALAVAACIGLVAVLLARVQACVWGSKR